LQRKKEKRLGFNGITELKEHPWFKDFNWDDLINKKLEPNWIPPYADNYYHGFKEEEKIGKETELCYEEIKNREEYQKYFEDYTFNDINLNQEKKEEKEFSESKKDKINLKCEKYEITSKIINKLRQEIK
jgi:hypothetical protein